MTGPPPARRCARAPPRAQRRRPGFNKTSKGFPSGGRIVKDPSLGVE